MKKILPLFIPLFFFWPVKVMEWFFASDNNETLELQIEPLPAVASCGTCPELIGLMVDPCRGSTEEFDNEFLIMVSGSGFDVDDLIVDLDPNNNIPFPGYTNNDIGTLSCPLTTPNGALISSLQSSAPCIQPASPGSTIPCCAIVIVFTDVDATSISPEYDFSYICSLGFDVFVLQNMCNRSGAFSNGALGCSMNCLRTTIISTLSCTDTITYDRSTFDSADPDTASVLVDELGVAFPFTSCQPDLSVLSFPALPSLPTITPDVTDISCYGLMDGEINITITGGMAPYCIDWSNLGGTCPGSGDPADNTALSPGTFSVTVTDASGCIDVGTYIISEPDSIFVELFSGGVSCAGDSSAGVFIITLTGGTPIDTVGEDTYLYDWDWVEQSGNEDFDTNPADGVEDRDINGLFAGTYSVTVMDANGCTGQASIQVVEDGSDLEIIVIDTTLDCNGDLMTINIEVIGGIFNDFQYDWIGYGDMDDPPDLVGVGAGIYTVMVTELTPGCMETATITITEPELLVASVDPTDATCNGVLDGSYMITVTGGTPPYNYNDGTHSGNGLSSPITVSPVAAGSYVVTVTDLAGCTTTANVTVSEPDPIFVDLFSGGVSCAGDSSGGVFIITLTGGTPIDTVGEDTYLYDWDWVEQSGNEDFDTNPADGVEDRDINGLFAGTYSVTVMDANGCTGVASIQVVEDGSDLEIIVMDTTLDCNGDLMTINIEVIGGIFNDFEYDWIGYGDTDDPQDLVGVGAGTYTVVVTELTPGCMETATIIITEPTPVVVTAVGDSAICGGFPSGSITLTFSGGTPLYDYVVTSPDTTFSGMNVDSVTISSLADGLYAISVTDANGCLGFGAVMIYEAPPLSAQVSSNPIICHDGTTNVWVVTNGGTPPFCFDWNVVGGANCPGISENDTIFNLLAGGGPYIVLIEDANGCTTMAATNPINPQLLTDTISASFCDGESVTIFGQTYLTGGTFMDTLLAVNGCDSVITIMISEDPLIMDDVMVDLCPGDTVEFYGVEYTMPGTYMDTIDGGLLSCDTIMTITINGLPDITNNIVDDFCQNTTYTLPDGSTTMMGGNYGPFVFTAGNGCDSIVNVALTMLSEVTNNISDDLCDSDTYTLPDGSTTTVGGSFGPYTFTSGNGCDSIVNVTLTLLPESINNIVDDFCQNDTYTLPDGSTTMSGGSFGPYTFVAANGCDSIVNVTLSLLPESMTNIVDDFCDSDTYTLPDGSTTTTGGSYGPYIFIAANGCDSIVNVTLTLLPESITNIVDDFCDSDTYTLPDGSTTTTGGSFGPYIFTAVNGCDSIVNVTLTLLPESINNIVDQFCENTTYTLPDGSTTMSGGTYGPFTFTAGNGCDSIVMVDLTEVPEITNMITDDFCDSDTYTLPDGSTTMVGGTFGPYIYTSASGCDSIVTVTLTLLPESMTNIVDDFCDSDTYILPDGSTTTTGGSYGPYIFTAANGCDSIVNVTLSLLPESMTNIVDDFCDSDTYTLPDGSTTTTGGSFGPYIFIAANGCDSIVNVTLTLLPESMTNIVDDFCDSDTYTLPDGSTTTTGGSFGPYIFIAANGCDSIVNVTLTLLPESMNNIVDQFCENTTYTLPDGSTTMSGGTYGPYTFTAANGCDSIVTVDLTEVPEITNMITDDFCNSDTYTLPDGSTTMVGGTFGPYIYTSASGCDSIVTVTLTLLPESMTNIVDDFCDGDTYTLPDGSTTTNGGSFGPFTFVAGNGCDSIVNVTLTLLPESTNNIVDDFCDSDTYTLPDGSTTTTGGSFGPYIFIAANGCDSIVNVTLSLLPESMNNIVDEFCDSDTYTLPDGSTTTTGGSFGPYIFTAANGCDSIVNVTLTLLPESMNNIVDQFCENTTYTLPDGSTTMSGGTYGPYTFTAANGCDSLVNVDLTEVPEIVNNITDDFCDGDTYTLPDGSTTSVGGSFGPYTFTSVNGCDSIVNVTLTLLPVSTNNIVDDFCQNDSYTLPDGSTTSVDGSFGPYTFIAANGCDSIVNVTLTLLPESTNNVVDDFCENDNYTLPDGSTTSVGGSFGPYTFGAANGCDSIVNVTLTLLPESINNITDDFCDSDTYTLPDGSTTSVGGSFGPYTFVAANGCDSIVNVTLTLLPESTNNIVDDFCENTSYTLPDGSTTMAGGIYGPFTFTAANGCDSIVTVDLTEVPEITNNITDNFCDSDTYTLPDGSTTNVGGTFGPYIYTSGNGCDSIVNVTLTLLPESFNTIVDDFCDSDMYTLPDGSTTTVGGSFGPYTFTASNGCDSIVNVTLTLLPESTNNIVDDFCENDAYTLPDGSTTLIGGSFGPFTFIASNGCDSIVNVTLTLLPESTNNIVDDFCENDSYTLPDGSTTSIGGSFGPYTFAAGNGCDSIVNVTLTLLPESTNNIVDDFCENDTYTLPDGSSTTVGGSFGPYTFVGSNGCDSIVNVTLTLIPEVTNPIVDNFCDGDSYTLPDGSSTTVGGSFGPYTFVSGGGCDSIVNVTLTLLPESTNNIVDDFCENDSYTLPDGSTTSVGGSFGPYTFVAANGCDSIVNLTLTLLPESTNNIVDDFCENDTYTLPDGSTTSLGGSFGPFIFVAANGCDSIVNVTLTLLPESTNNIVDDFCENDSYTLPDGSTTSVGGSFGPYTFVAANGCDSIVNVNLTLLPESTNNIVDEFCENDTYTLPDGSTTSLGGSFGPYTFVAVNGCDSIVNVTLTLVPEVTNNIVDDFCENTSYTLPDGSTTTVGGNFGPYIFTSGSGCDSIVNVSLTLLPESTNNIVDDFCENDTYILPDGSTTSVGGSFGPYTFIATNGCDSIVNVTLTLLSESTNNIVDDFCENDTYTLPDGSTTSVGGSFGPFIFAASNGCDSIVNVTLTLLPEPTNNIMDVFCENDSYTLPDGSTTTIGGSFGPYTFVATNGCDSIVNVTLTLLPESTNNIVDDFCENTNYTLPDGSTTTVGGSFGPYTFVASNGCDSIVNVTLTLVPEVTNNIVDDFCENDTYTLPDGSTTSVGGSYGPFTFNSSNGCDSIVNVSLTLLPESTNNIVDDFCENDTYTLPDGSTTSVGGSFGPYTFTAANGCDSIVNMTLTLLPESTNNIVDDFCENDTYTLPDGSMTSIGGSFGPFIFAASNGCDSIVNVTLTLLPEPTNNIVDDFCENTSYTLPDGSTTTVGGSFGPYTFVAANGCDSMVNVNLTLIPVVTTDIVDDFCENSTYTLPDGSTTMVGGSFGPYLFTSSEGCDSTVTVDLTVISEITNNIVDDFCQNDTYTLPDGSTTSIGGNFGPYLFTSSTGCDSIVNVNLTVVPEIINDIVDDFCENDIYTLPDGSTTSVGGSYGPYTFTGASGCDSIVNLTLTLLPESTNNIADDFCENDTYTLPDGSTTTVGGSFGPYTFVAANGCDSIVNVTLTLIPESINNIVDDFCENDTYTLPDGSTTSVGGSFGPYVFVSTNGCDSIVNVDLTVIPEITNNIVDNFCENTSYTLPDGSTTTVGGSFGPYLFTASSGCDSIVTVDLTEVPELTNDIVDSFCDGSSYTLPDGSTTTTGGVYGPYTFISSNGCDSIVTVDLTIVDFATGEELYSGCEGDGYSVVVNGNTYDESNPSGTETLTSGGGCDSIVTINLTFAPAPVAQIDPIGPFCADAGQQTLTASPAGGVWSGAVSSDQFNPGSLGAGQHEVIYTVSQGSCSDADTLLITVHPQIMVSCTEITPESSPGAMDGVGGVDVSNGAAPYNITWTGPGNGSDILNADGTFQITGLTAGSYNVVVLDANGCSGACFFTITTSAGCTIQIDSVNVIDVGCPGGTNGAVQIYASGGVTPYSYSIDGVNYVSSDFFSGLGAGTWLVYVQDGIGCITSSFIDILSGTGPAINLVSVTPASCGEPNGVIEVNASGGTPPYDFSVGGPFQPIGLFSGLAADIYDVVVSDASGCNDTIQVTVTEEGAPVIDDITIEDPACGQSNGVITIVASGGAPPLSYVLDGGTPQSSNVLTGVSAGSHIIQVVDANGCKISEDVLLNNVGGPTIDDTVITPTTCGVNDGAVGIIASGGTGALQYSIGGPFTSNPLFVNLASGILTVTVRDAAGCTASEVINIPTLDGPQIGNVGIAHTSCGEDDGQLTIPVTGGLGTITYCISPGGCQDDDNQFPDLGPGVYTITVEDENGCSAQMIVEIDASEGPTVDAIQLDEHCDMGDGYAILFGIGGVEPYMYSFDGRPYAINDFYGNLQSDFYEICVRDAQGCIDCKEIFIDNDDPPEFDSVAVTSATCTQNIGTITMYATSFLDLEYSINGVFYQTSNVFTGLAPGTYTIYIKDQFDCITTQQVTIEPVTSPTVDNVIVSNAQCTSPGSLTVVSSGGNGAHLYSLDNVIFQASPVFSGLGAGNYTVYIKDQLECTDQATATILGTTPDMISLLATICEGDTYTLGSEIFDVTGIYPVTFTGSDGCDSIVTLDLTVEVCCTPVTNSIDDSICEGDSYQLNGVDYATEGTFTDTILAGATNGCDSILVLNLDVIASVETTEQAAICDGDSYDWNGDTYILSGIYTDTLSSALGCDSVVILDLLVNALPSADAGADQTISCSALTVTLAGSGNGTPQWSGPGISDPDIWQQIVSVPGLYTLTVISAAGCTAEDIVEVFADVNAPIANAGPDGFITCAQDSVTLSGSANQNGMLFTWSGQGITGNQVNEILPIVTTPGIYSLIVTDTANNCASAPDTVTVTDIRVNVLANIVADGNIDCNQSVVVLSSTGSSGGPGIVYIWLNPLDMITIDVPGIIADMPGMYYLFALDTLSECQAVDSHLVMNVTAFPPADAGVDTVLDCNVGFLELEANVSSQQSGLLFFWSGPAGGIISDPTQREIIIIDPGQYVVMVTDTANGCSSTDTVNVIDSRDLPDADAGPTQFIYCSDDSAILDGSASSVGVEYAYIWNGPGVQDVHTITVEVYQPGWYHLLVMNLETGCEASDSAEVKMADFLSGAEITINDPFCLGDLSGEIIVEQPDGGVAPFTYSLDGIVFQSSPVFTGLPAGTHSLIIRDNVNCEWDTVVVINEGVELILNVGPDLELDFGDMADLHATVIPPGIIDSIIWDPLDALSCNNCLNPVVTALYQQNFVVTATVYAGSCIATDNLLVSVDNEFDIFVPNVFSPNYDNINDYVTAWAGDEVRRILEFEIFDRWGELIFRGLDFPPNVPELGWDGKFKGDFMNPGVFVYMLKVELIDGSELILSGDITLVR